MRLDPVVNLTPQQGTLVPDNLLMKDLDVLKTLVTFLSKTPISEYNTWFRNVLWANVTYLPSMTLNSLSQSGKAPHATTLSVGMTGPLKRKISNIKTMLGLISGREGHTVNTDWWI